MQPCYSSTHGVSFKAPCIACLHSQGGSCGLARQEPECHSCSAAMPVIADIPIIWYVQALEGMQAGQLEQVPIQDYFPAAKELSPVEFAEA